MQLGQKRDFSSQTRRSTKLSYAPKLRDGTMRVVCARARHLAALFLGRNDEMGTLLHPFAGHRRKGHSFRVLRPCERFQFVTVTAARQAWSSGETGIGEGR